MSERSPFTIAPEQLRARLGEPNLSIVDGSWYLPAQNRNGAAEYAGSRIPGAVYFNIDEIADKSTDLPHMLPKPEVFAAAVGAMGIAETDDIVVYDGPGLFSAPRVWWTFWVMGAKKVRVLDGGFDRWKAAGFPVETGEPKPAKPATFRPKFQPGRVHAIDAIRANLKTSKALILDARPAPRFAGHAPEPRPGLRSGHMPGAKNLPSDRFAVDGRLKDIEELRDMFDSVYLDPHRAAITSCGSGVTAAIISLALESIGHKDHALYDGSWAEWGKADDAPVARWD
jgi:thiosulfate/3-mercaptopyruvate sulfurtransferase